MLSLSWNTMRTRLSGFVGAFLAVLCGTAIVAACGVLIESGLRAGVPPQRYAAAAVVVGGPQSVRPEGVDILGGLPAAEQPTIDAGLATRVAAVPGVRAAINEVDFPATVITESGLTAPQARAHNWSAAALAPFTLTAGEAPNGPDQVVLDADLAAKAGAAPGHQIQIETPSSTREYRVVGVVSAPGVTRQSALYFTDDRATALYGRPGQVHAIGVLADDSTQADDLAERVEQALKDDHVEVTTGTDRSTVEFSDVSQARAVLMAIAGSFGGVALLVMVFVVSSTLALSVTQRRREFALLRAIAATPRQIRALIGAETLLVSGVAAALGGLGGFLVAGWLRDAFAEIGIVPSDFELALGPIPVVAALLLGVGAARFAAYVAGRGPSKISPVEALSEAVIERRGLGRVRTTAGFVVTAAGFGVATLPLFLDTPLVAAFSAMAALVIVIGVGLLGPTLVGAAIRLVTGPLSRIAPVGGYLAAANSRANTRRLAAAITPVMLAVGFAVAQVFSQTTHADAVRQQTAAGTLADHVIVSQSGGLPSAVADAARQVPGVASASSVVRTQVFTTTTMGDNVDLEQGSALGLDGDQVRGNLDLGTVTGDLAALTGDTVALSENQADWMDKQIGDPVPLHFGDGRVGSPRLVATYTHNLAFGDFVLPAALAPAHTTDTVDSSVLVRLEPDADPAVVTVALRALSPTVTVGDRGALKAADTTAQEQGFWVNLVAFGVILGYIVIAVGNTLVMTTAQRGREFAMMRMVGTTRRQVRRMMWLEAGLTGGIAAVIGTLIPAVPLVLLGIGLAGDPIPSGPFPAYLAIVAGAVLLALVATMIPTRLALRVGPVTAINLRD
ncbi:FtsX-like permease family protein [Actinokineospora globicatena]|uniref:ABC transporter permease n=1 Tax=Actinokineospora globicatena TaxID=103729 RepID=A0A9W6QRE2_9PSEU|nr:FtsX-like permease family protein [Actinokineospora globicatena]GLW93400.1 ABC transporter permease [Actinokineospora globicatena]